MIRTWLAIVAALTLTASASAAPNVANVTQKGSLLVFPDIRVDDFPQIPGNWNTLVRLQNDGSADVDVECYWMDGFKNRVDFIVPLTRNQAVWFDARTGQGTLQVNPFPTGAANGFTNGNRHPFLDVSNTPAATPGHGAYREGLLACWVVDDSGTTQVKWNHLSGTATVHYLGAVAPAGAAYEYNAYAFFVPTGTDLDPVGPSGTLRLNGVDYDACPLYLIGQFSPDALNAVAPGALGHRLAVTGCSLNLNQDWLPVWTKLQFDVWNSEEVKFTGAYECADSWHETDFSAGSRGQATSTGAPPTIGVGFVDGVDAAGQNFLASTLATYAARYRVQGVKSAQCDRTKPASGHGADVAAVTTQAVGLLAVQYTRFTFGAFRPGAGTTLTGAGKFSGQIVWDAEMGLVPEGGAL